MHWLLLAAVLQSVPATGVTRARSRTIYLNRTGATLVPGANDARIQRSSIVSAPTVIAPWTASAAEWSATVACMQDVWSRFDVTITDVDPGSIPHIEALFGGAPADVGLPASVAGVSPFATDCGVIENSIVFTFTDALPRNPRLICEVMSQELGHSYGLDHELAAADPMSYLPFAGEREFQDVDAQCGEHTPRSCACGATQNSLQLLRARIGDVGSDHVAPELVVMAPRDQETVAPGFVVAIEATDNLAVTGVTVFIDGAPAGTTTAPSLDLATDEDLALGAHAIRVEATDADGNVTTRELRVVIELDAGSDALGCAAGGGSSGGSLGLLLLLLRRRTRPRTCLEPRAA